MVQESTRSWIWLLPAIAGLALGCTRASEPTSTTPSLVTTSPSRPDPGFYLMLMWHQHQPRYPILADGTVSRPWVRVHATKDYYDMAALVEEYPALRVTFNLTPVLLLQLEELTAGTRDVYWAMSDIPATDLSEEQQAFISQRFFDVNGKIVERFPRFQELAQKPDGGFSTDELRDLQVLFNLAWTDPDFLAREPLKGLVEKGRDFSEEDKEVLFAEHERIVSEVIPLHARLWNEGRVEVTTSPLAHPILPLISDSTLASVGDPTALLPENRYQEIPDADQQVIRGLDVAERLLGRRPVGMWPGEGSVAQLVMSLFSKNGVRWVASGEDVLAQSLGIGSFTRDAADVVEQADLLYRPYQAVLKRNEPVPMFFRDGLLSDLIGFEYSGMEGPAAASDFMDRLEAISKRLDQIGGADPEQPYVVSVILDGENAWEHYLNDGKDFLRALYQELSESDFIRTITPSEYLERFAEPEGLEEVWPGAWFQPNFATWIGEEEEASAWDYLYQVRRDLEKAPPSAGYDQAYEKMLFAEGSDWFWWYGSDQDSGDDGYFDAAFRELLGQVYDALGVARPAFVDVPIIPQRPVMAELSPSELITIEVDGIAEDAWAKAGLFTFPEEGALQYAFDRENLYLKVEVAADAGEGFDLYLGLPEGEKNATTLSGDPLGFGATHVVRWSDAGAVLSSPLSSEEELAILSATGGDLIELAVPLSALGSLEAGDSLLIKVNALERLFPSSGPALAQVPDISNVVVFLAVTDPIGDDHGPGGYNYPTDAVFTAGSYDLEAFQVGTEGEDVVFTFDLVAPIQNPWGSPRGFSVQTFDIYVDIDPGAGTGSRLLIPGRNAALVEGHGWEYGITVEGWEPAVYVADKDGSTEETKPSFDVVVFADKGKLRVRLPLQLLGGGDPSTWGYAAMVLSQEGFPSSGVRRVRDVEATAQQWRGGGAPSDINHTRIFDLAWEIEGEQESSLSNYPATTGSVDGLGPDDFGQVSVVVAE